MIKFNDQYTIEISSLLLTPLPVLKIYIDNSTQPLVVISKNNKLHWQGLEEDARNDQTFADIIKPILANQEFIKFCNRVWKNRKFD